MSGLPSELRAYIRPTAALGLSSAREPDDSWRARAACLGVDFMTLPEHADEARAVCRTCPVFDDCRAWVLDEKPEIPGVLAGLEPKERGLKQCIYCGMVGPRGSRRGWPRITVCWACYDVEIRPHQTQRRVTQRDVAQYVGVSPTTVSSVVQGKPVNEETRRKVLEAIETLGYKAAS